MQRTNRIGAAVRRAAWTLLAMGLVAGTALPALAEDDMPMGGGAMGMGGGSGQTPAAATNNAELQRRMDDLRHHSMVMEGIQDTKKLLDEMRKHMKMLDDMMAEMVRGQSGAGGMGSQPMNHM